MRLLIAGWQGQLARALVELAPGAADVEALAIGRPALDICEPASITRAMTDFRPNVIINTAAYTAVDRAEDDVQAALALNRDGARMLAEAAAKRGAALLHVSTNHVFDGSKPAPYREDEPTLPLGIYGRSKLEGEAAVRAAHRQHLILRTSWVLSGTGANFIRTMLQQARSAPSVQVVDDQVGSPTYAAHLAVAILGLARQVDVGLHDTDWGTYHIAAQGHGSWCDVAREVFRVSASLGGPVAEVEPVPSAAMPTRVPRPPNACLDCSRLQERFGIVLPPWQDGITEAVQRALAEDGRGTGGP